MNIFREIKIGPFVPIGGVMSLSTNSGEIPTRRFKKAIARTGKFVKVSEGVAFVITEESIDHWIEQFHKMRKNDVKVPIPAMHQDEEWEKRLRDYDGNPKENAGFVDDLWKEQTDDGATLWMACTLVGNDSIELSGKADVSVFVPDDYTDGSGNVYPRPITHVALVTNPVLPGLGEFIPLAASMQILGDPKMRELLLKLAGVLGIEVAEGATDEELTDAVVGQIDSLVKSKEEPAPEVEASEEGEEEKKEDKPAEGGEGDGKKEEEEEGEDEDAPAITASMSKIIKDHRETKIDALLERGKVTKAVADDLRSRYCGEKRVALALSQKGSDPEFDSIISLLEKNPPVIHMKSRSGVQALSHAVSKRPEEKTLAERNRERTKKKE